MGVCRLHFNTQPGSKMDHSSCLARIVGRVRGFHGVLPLLTASLLMASVTGCSTTAGNIALGTTAGTGLGGMLPNGGIEQTYYLGIFDPREQMKTPQFYRVRVRGQSSVLSQTKYASGWVRADLIDSLSSHSTFDSKNGSISWTGADDAAKDKINTGRRLVMFGPEGFREAPADHRLVIVMGASPEKFFSAIDESLGMIARATQQPVGGADASQKLLQKLAEIRAERARLGDLLTEIKAKGE